MWRVPYVVLASAKTKTQLISFFVTLKSQWL